MDNYIMHELLTPDHAKELQEKIEDITNHFKKNNNEFDEFFAHYNVNAFENEFEGDSSENSARIDLNHCIEDREKELKNIKELMEKVELLHEEINSLYEKEKTEIHFLKEAEKESSGQLISSKEVFEKDSKKENKVNPFNTKRPRSDSTLPLISSNDSSIRSSLNKVGLIYIPLETVVNHRLNVLIPYFTYLQKWSKCSKFNVLYDSRETPKDDEDWFRPILNHPNLYFINVDQNGSIFGGFTFKAPIEPKKYVVDPNHFLFSLRIEQTDFVHQYKSKKPQGLMVCEKSKIMYGFGLSESCMDIYFAHKKGSCCFNLSKNYINLENTGLNTLCHPNDFVVTRTIILEMK
ncbi:hypothetical protein EDI_033130 [Entamoeba dispar SAW760]|uniref:TLDc domain-containing protein n=1 Tax=Entamoeba dispar (strain ATCC PRA-260 / SAW760) TaxID=370354 RepID=B0E8G3_ENTDS|nr:uncharacterized protein EDI_033130 [Entamoeba dispar SAW760]EDR29206.1 hypothetical protein EDI_033130 [Entamoeba dispar SAW760]|eukprot:EDR29206.1 hypothetical protein EDI_033130 [Entamoeba dispar SAW760]